MEDGRGSGPTTTYSHSESYSWKTWLRRVRRTHRFPFIWIYKSILGLVSQWMEESLHLSQENAATAFRLIAERSKQPSTCGFYLSAGTNMHCSCLKWEVIYAKPGSEVDLDSLIQETLRLTTSVKDTCSESYIGGKEPYVDKRWSGLLEMRNRI
eukprot:TRINITY_DN9246_c0_g1_i3.p2 TRINITY_DN9246_c0_g1~~TRINITY_DN9246_c0_g1_i3.p2  ORF type:complete len:154 (-),score=23.93 TRINITY_DN9246_c0_g1_i3:358-819(-)